MSDALEAARWLASLGMHVFPVAAGGKQPVGRWTQLATTDAEKIGAMFTGEPRNIGIACGPSGLLVLDEDAAGELERFAASLGVTVPHTFTVQTAKGRHLYFRRPAGVDIGNKAGLNGFKVDLRGAGGYVVGPGSVHETGRRYVPVDPAAPIADAPGWLLSVLTRRQERPAVPRPARPPLAGQTTPYGATPLNDELAKLAAAQPLTRNDTLNRTYFAVRQLVDAGHIDGAEAEARFRATALQIGLTDAETRETMASATRSARDKPRTDVPDPSSNGSPAADFLAGLPREHAPAALNGDQAPAVDAQVSTRHALEFQTLAELRAEVAAAGPRRWLLRGAWPAGDYGVHAAEMKAQKTWNTVDLAVSVASGTPWLGAVEVDQGGAVLMFAGEGSKPNLVRRIEAVCVSRGIDQPDDLPIVICARAPKLSDQAHLAVMRATVAELRPALVTLDPFYLSARGASGGDLYAMGAMLEGAQHACQDAGAALFVVTHHNRNTGASGALRISGAGPAEWGRVLITAEVKRRHTDAETKETTVTTELDIIGGEVAGGKWRLTRKIRAENPDDLDSPFHYSVTLREREHGQDGDAGDVDMPPARVKILEAVRAAPEGGWTIDQIQDWIAQHGDGIVPKRTTCSEHLNALLKAGLVDAADPGQGGRSGGLRSPANLSENLSEVSRHPTGRGVVGVGRL